MPAVHGGRMKYEVPDTVLRQPLDGELVLLDLASGRYFGLPGVAARAFDRLSELGDSEAVVAALLTEYRVDEAQLRGDLDALFASLAAAELIRPAA
jgi:hypothetical protein